jgi:hypothetical protein
MKLRHRGCGHALSREEWAQHSIGTMEAIEGDPAFELFTCPGCGSTISIEGSMERVPEDRAGRLFAVLRWVNA